MAGNRKQRALPSPDVGVFVVHDGTGGFWAGGKRWVPDWRSARLFPAGPGDPWAEADRAARRLCERDRPCGVGYLPAREWPVSQVVIRQNPERKTVKPPSRQDGNGAHPARTQD